MAKHISDRNQLPLDEKRENYVDETLAVNDSPSDNLNPQQKQFVLIKTSLAMRWVDLKKFFNILHERALHLLEEIKFLNRQKSDRQEKEMQMVPMQGADDEHDEKAVITDTFQEYLSRLLNKLYKKPVMSASGKTVKVSVVVQKDNDETPFEPTLQSMGDESPGDSTTQYSSLHLRQHDLDSGLVEDLGHFRVSHRNNSPGGITGLQIKGIKPEDLESTTPWEDSRTDQYSRAFEVMGASNKEFRLKIKDVDKISVEARKGLGRSLGNSKVAAYRLTFESCFGRYKLNKDHTAFVSESWGDADVYRTNPTKIRNLNQNCPISGKAIKTPVLASDGYIYEKEVIEGRSTLSQLRLLTVEETKQLIGGVGKENSLASEQQESPEAQPEPSPEKQSELPLESQSELPSEEAQPDLPEAVEVPQAKPYNGRMPAEAECTLVDEAPEVDAIRIDELSENKTAKEEFLNDPRPDFTRENQDPSAPPLESSSSLQQEPSSSSNSSKDNYHQGGQAPSAPQLESSAAPRPKPSLGSPKKSKDEEPFTQHSTASPSGSSGLSNRPEFTRASPKPEVRAETTFNAPVTSSESSLSSAPTPKP